MRILVTGGTGTVGSQVVEQLLARGAEVQVLTRDPDKARLPHGATAVQGNLLDIATLRRVFTGVDGVFLLNAVSPTESQEALLAITAMRGSSVRHLVYLSVHQVDAAPWLPHFGAKVGIEAAVKASGIPYTILRPDNFFQNDYWYKDVLLQYGVYPQPLGDVGTSRVDVRDIGEAAAIAFTQPGHAGQTYDLVGPEVVTGPSTAAVWSEVLGRPIAYGGNDLDAWEPQAAAMLPDWMAFDFRHMYAHFQDKGLRAAPEAVARLTSLLGHPPRGFRAFADECAAAWSRP
jgi:uncharacterized protein YbjT (DUF2867 family)